MKPEDRIGEKHGMLTIVEMLYPKARCVCDCGNETTMRISSIISGGTSSCGCYKMKMLKERSITHGLSKHPIYTKWVSIKARCFNQNTAIYKDYGGRGIFMCKEWADDFMSFYHWCLNNGWEKNLDIDRIDNNLGYSPDNCRFVTAKENARNRRSSRFIEHLGENKTVAEWAEIYNIHPTTLKDRINRQWDIKKAFETPPDEYARLRSLNKAQV